MNDAELLRYSRHILLDEIGLDGQQRILDARVLLIGAGGLGSPAALYLAGAGVGHVTLVDDDAVDLTNLQRQIAHTEARVGETKVESARAAMTALNSHMSIAALPLRVGHEGFHRLVESADVVLDCCDNFATRQSINAACVRSRVPLVSGAAIRFDGQVSVFDARDPRSPCYACLFPPDAAPEETRCAVLGVFAPLVGIIGSLQAAEALKIIVGIDRSLAGRLLMLDARTMEWNQLHVPRDPGCPVCGH